jgi:hypothetical protein
MRRAVSLRRKIFYGFTLSAIAILLLLPATGWLARLQLLPFTTPAGATVLLLSYNYSLQDQYDARTERVVAANRGDFKLRYAHATNTISKDVAGVKSLRRAFELNDSFPNNPAVISAILKTMLRTTVKLHREDQYLLDSVQPWKASDTSEESTDPGQAAKFIAFATAGEKLEPQNAYFPVMAAFGYFVSGNDEEAIAAWIRASQKTGWSDYTRDEIVAKWALARAVNNGHEIGAITRLASINSFNYIQFNTIRSSARMATVMAWKAEQQKDLGKALVIRQATRRIGQNIQTDRSTYIGNEDGMNILNICAHYSIPPKQKLPSPLEGQPPPATPFA